MKRPEKIVMWLHADQKPNEPFVDHNGKPDVNYFIELPYWLTKAYNPRFVKVEIRDKPLSMSAMIAETNREETQKYIEKNWRKKIDKHYRLNHGFLLVTTKAMGRGWFKSLEDYNNYHKELRELNKKYLGEN